MVKALFILVAVNLTISFIFPVAVGLAVILVSIFPAISVFKQLNDLVWVKSHLEDSLLQFDHFRTAYNKALTKCQEMSVHSDDGELSPQHNVIIAELKSTSSNVLK